MKWGKYLNVVVNETPDWAPSFINYKRLKGVLKDLWADPDVLKSSAVSMAASDSAAIGSADDGRDDDSLTAAVAALDFAMSDPANPADPVDLADPADLAATETTGTTDPAGPTDLADLADSVDHDVSDSARSFQGAVDGNPSSISPTETQRHQKIILDWHGLLPDNVPIEESFLSQLDSQVFSKSPQSAIFINELNLEVAKISSFFAKKSQEAYAKLEMVSSTDDFAYADRLMSQVNAMVTKLREFSTVNYTGTVKILKKHDKSSGMFLRSIYVRNILSRQSFHTDVGRLLLAVDAREKSFYHDSDDENSLVDNSSRRRGVGGARPVSVPGYYYRDLNNDVRSLGLVKKEALCVVVCDDGQLMTVREAGTVKLLKASLESGETTADAAVRAIYEAAGVTATVQEAIGEYMSTSRKGTIYDAYLLRANEVLENWDKKNEVTRVWMTVDEALGSISDVSSVRVLRKVFDTK